ncbi:hemicentin-2-like [Xenopus tropicalis]|uniref:Hemicentin-2-like n=1 Tax=Xenopus tropicalis TaxID=8364 RepID=A0A8J1J6I3_XENTR|nr:hemicentin-2-like [Xenopus tropicalis]
MLGKIRNGACVSGCGETSMIFSNGTFWKSQAEREDEGTYSVDVYNGFGVHFHRAEIFLQIIDIVQVALGESAILPPCRTAPEEPYEAQWRKGAELLQKLHKGSCIGDCGERYRVLPNGSLWLGPVQQGDGGMYSVELYDVSGHRIHRAEIFLQINNETPGGKCLHAGGQVGGTDRAVVREKKK